jgi:Autotransporter beta-domain
MRSTNLLITFVSRALIVLVSLAGTAGLATASTATSKIDDAQPVNNPALAAGLISGTGLQGAALVGGAVGSFAGAGGSGAQVGNIKRFALPGQGVSGTAAAAGGNLWNAWGAYSRSDIAFEYAPLHSSGKVDVYLAGIDYTFGGNKVIGLAYAHDRTDVNLNFNAGKLSGNGNTLSPYFGIAFDRNWSFDATIGFGRSNVDTAVAAVTGSTDVDRTLGSLGLNFRNSSGNWQFSGRAAYLAVRDKLGAYTLSNGTFVPDGTVNVSQARFSGQLAYLAGNITPYIGVSYINDLRRPDQAPIGGIVAANDDDAWTPTVGIRFRTDGTLYGSLQYSTERSRSEVKNNQLLLNLGVRF